MSELGLFPLGVVLLPTEQIPLHIFEDRYQELIGECLDDDREFGLIYADDDDPDEADPAEKQKALDLFARLVELTGAEVEAPTPDLPQLSYALAGRFEFAAELKQRLLQLRSERERVSLLAQLLEGAAEAVARERDIAERAATNGK